MDATRYRYCLVGADPGPSTGDQGRSAGADPGPVLPGNPGHNTGADPGPVLSGKPGRGGGGGGGKKRIKERNKKKKNVSLRLGTLNVGSMTGRSTEIVDMLVKRRVDICCVQETRWKGGKAKMIKANKKKYKFYWQGCKEGLAGVGVLVSERMIDHAVEVVRYSERLMRVKFALGKRMINVISAYAPQSGRNEKEKEDFWENLRQTVVTMPGEETVWIGGDLNGHLGKM